MNNFFGMISVAMLSSMMTGVSLQTVNREIRAKNLVLKIGQWGIRAGTCPVCGFATGDLGSLRNHFKRFDCLEIAEYLIEEDVYTDCICGPFSVARKVNETTNNSHVFNVAKEAEAIIDKIALEEDMKLRFEPLPSGPSLDVLTPYLRRWDVNQKYILEPRGRVSMVTVSKEPLSNQKNATIQLELLNEAPDEYTIRTQGYKNQVLFIPFIQVGDFLRNLLSVVLFIDSHKDLSLKIGRYYTRQMMLHHRLADRPDIMLIGIQVGHTENLILLANDTILHKGSKWIIPIRLTIHEARTLMRILGADYFSRTNIVG